MEWTKKVPTKPGIYFRNNPPISHRVRQDIFEIDGKLFVSNSETSIYLDDWHGAKRMWWFGPIPEVPTD